MHRYICLCGMCTLIFCNHLFSIFLQHCTENTVRLHGTSKNTHPVDTSHILMVLSRDDDKIKSPFGTNATLDTLWS